jgi:hypothetical protein
LTEEDFAEALEADRSAEQDPQTPAKSVPASEETAQHAQDSPDK